MLYMVIEKYRHGPGPVYQRAAERGRMLPDGLLDVWQSQWADLTEFEVVPVLKSAAASRVDVQWG